MRKARKVVVHALKPGIGETVNLCDGTEHGHIIGYCGYDLCDGHKKVTCPACLKKMGKKR